MLIAFTSFIFTWKNDQDKVVGSTFFELLFNTEVKVENWLGKIGAEISHMLIHGSFGISAFIIVLIVFLLGFKILFRISLLPLRKTFKYSFFVIIWLSLLMAFIFDDSLLYLGGAFGYEVNKFLITGLGSIGTGFLLTFILIGFLALNFSFQFDFIDNLFNKNNSTSEIDNEPNLNNATAQSDIVEEENKEIESIAEQVNNGASLSIEVSGTEKNIIEESIILSEDSSNETIEVASNELELVETELEPIVETTTIADDESVNEEEEELSLDIKTIVEEKLSKKEVNKLVNDFGEFDPTLELSKFKMPPIDLLKSHGEDKIVVNREELEENKNKIVQTLKNYNIEISKIKATIGPTVTLYEIIPAPGVRISKIKNLEDDIALSLAALGIRIIAPIPGKGTIGIEVPNQKPEIVSMRAVVSSEKFQKTDMELPIVLGKTITNETFTIDLAKMPHCLMAGATGQGKSVGLNAMLVSLLYKKHPSQVKFVLVDPKKVELTLFNKIERHYLAKLPNEEEAIITDTSKVVATLNSLCIEMDDRYEMLKKGTARNIIEYNRKFIQRKLNPENGHRYLPYIVVVVDEFADLIMTAGKEVETPIARIAQLARAIGIHLIIATQRPSVNIITGTIKANFPTRIAFRVTSRIDSKTILDTGGADQLIGRGDMLLSTGSMMIRLQCAFVDTPEVEAICEYIGDQQGYPDALLLPEFEGEVSEGGSGSIEDIDRDILFEDAARVVVNNQQGSASLLQRRLKLGYNRAGRIVDQLEAAGIIGQFEGSKARQVLIPDEVSLEHLLNSLKK
tara:strand:- start:13391 stop:15775 length:2385 start_codon:yes stop_codon:yes gene_type:complete